MAPPSSEDELFVNVVSLIVSELCSPV